MNTLNRSTARKAFTLVELLVVIAIIGMLIGMTLPAIQATRENARRVRCVSRMHDLSIAMARYVSANEVLPPGTTNPTGPIVNTSEGQHRGWLIELLPYVDEQTAYKRIDKDSSVNAVKTRAFGNIVWRRLPARRKLRSTRHRSSVAMPDRITTLRPRSMPTIMACCF